MKPQSLLFAAVALVFPLRAQPPGGAYNADQLDQLVAPIALYPDPLVAVILPASTFPSDVTLANRFVAAQMDPTAIAAQPWDASVKALAHYPALLKWMDDNLAWTQALGYAVYAQQADVMRAIQTMRARAISTGVLVSTPQQRVETVGGIIRIVPVDTAAVYLPRYDPGLVYDVQSGYRGPVITFGIAYPVGDWLAFECNWDDFAIWTGPWHGGRDYRRDRRSGAGATWSLEPGRARDVSRGRYQPAGPPPRPRSGVGGGVEKRAPRVPGGESKPAPGDGNRQDRH